MARDDFFEQLARDHVPAAQAVYEGPDGTARRPVCPIRDPHVAPKQPSCGPASRHRHLAAAAALLGFLIVAGVATLVAEPHRSVDRVTTGARSESHPPQHRVTRPWPQRRARSADRTRQQPPRQARPSRQRPPRDVRHDASQLRPLAEPARTPRPAPAPPPTQTHTPGPAARPPSPLPTVASEPSCEFPPC